jgi:lipoate-protein ligase B
VRAFVCALEDWIIATLGRFNLTAGRRANRVGVWVERPDKPPAFDGRMAEDKIAAIGIRLRRWVSFHGISINVEPDLSHFDGIVPCGIADRHLGVTSLVDVGRRSRRSSGRPFRRERSPAVSGGRRVSRIGRARRARGHRARAQGR